MNIVVLTEHLRRRSSSASCSPEIGQFDHVRLYGKDYKKRLEASGFSVQVVPCSDAVSHSEIRRSELIADEDQAIWWCRKPLPNDGARHTKQLPTTNGSGGA